MFFGFIVGSLFFRRLEFRVVVLFFGRFGVGGGVRRVFDGESIFVRDIFILVF